MQTTNETPVFLKTYDLYKVLYEAVKKFNKSDKYSLGEKIKEKVIELIEAITKAGYAKAEWKVVQIEQAIITLELIKVFIRLAYDTNCLNEKQYLNLQECAQEIGRMLGGWKKSQ